MKCGVRFCGGCNPRYDRRQALNQIDSQVKDLDFINAAEGVPHDLLLVIGGCSNCCASYEQFETKDGILKMWDKTHIERILDDIQKRK